MEHSEQEHMEILDRVMNDTSEVQLDIAIPFAWTVAAALVNLHEHPGLGKWMKQRCVEIVKAYSQPIIDRHRKAKRLLDPKEKIPQSIFIKRAKPIMEDSEPVIISTSVREIWLTIALIQLVTRHPNLDITATTRIIEIAHTLQQIIADTHPDSLELIEMGWNPKYDIAQGDQS